MREIKFRGKRIDNGEWVHGDLTKDMANKEPEIIYQSFDGVLGFEEFYEVKPETVGQYTGLKDKNGKMIYEGDILDWQFKSVHEDGVVKFIGSGFWVTGPDEKSHMPFNAFVIGSIHDNPELLDKEIGI